MQIQQRKYTSLNGWEILNGFKFNGEDAQLVLVFGSTTLLLDQKYFLFLKSLYPNADILINSTAGEIICNEVNDDSLSITALHFNATKLKSFAINISEYEDSYSAGKMLALNYEKEDLVNLLVISDGLKINGSYLVEGLRDNLPENTIITGGLAGDGGLFKSTLVGLNDSPIEGCIATIGFYSNRLLVKSGSFGGWDSFGPERLITKSYNNILYELDGKPALEIYKKYLGEYAKDLPSSGLLFPLCIRTGNDESLVRTIISLDEDSNSLIFAGNMPIGSYARLMKANLDRLIDGASNAANSSLSDNLKAPEFALLISCVGRKLVLDQRVEEEVEAIRQIFGEDTITAGFYSYGEISPTSGFMKCELHNQTMTITTFTEF